MVWYPATVVPRWVVLLCVLWLSACGSGSPPPPDCDALFNQCLSDALSAPVIDERSLVDCVLGYAMCLDAADSVATLAP